MQLKSCFIPYGNNQWNKSHPAEFQARFKIGVIGVNLIIGANKRQSERTDMYTEKMGSAQRLNQASYVRVKLWFNGLNPAKPWLLTYPPVRELLASMSKLGKYVSILDPDHERLESKPSCNHGHQTRPLDTPQIHLWKADDGGVWLVQHTTPWLTDGIQLRQDLSP